MKNIFRILVLFSALILIPLSTQAQCKGFAKKICKLQLMPYIHDGNFHAAILTEGEEAELYKTFYSGQEYRIAICGSEALPQVGFKIVDSKGNLLYDNSNNNYKETWDFKVESSQQLKIEVKVPVINESGEDIISGCVAIMFGFKQE